MSADLSEDRNEVRTGAKGRGAADDMSADLSEDRNEVRTGAKGRGAADGMSAAVATGQVFALPDLGEGLTEAEITEWLVQEGEHVVIDQHVVVVETAKASVEVPCPYEGTVTTRHGSEGEVLEVGQPLITIGGAAGSSADGPEEPAETPSSDETEGSGAVLIGYGTSETGGRRRRRRRVGHASAATGTHASTTADSRTDARPMSAPADRAQPDPADTRAPRVISPIVRRLAKDRRLDLHQITPGPDGVIRRSDVEAASSPSAAPAPSSAPASAGDERIPITGLRRMVSEKLSTSRREIPDATTWVDVDATGLLQAREALRSPDQDVSLLGLLARICVAGLQRFPELNSSVDTERREIVRHTGVHLGFAAQSPRGLVVPVVHDAGTMGTRALSASLRDLTARAREDTLAPTELTGGTFTLNNYGVFGVDGSTPIINHPEAAMLGVGRIVDKPWVVDGELTVRKVTQLSFTFDHRVCDGGVAGGFLRFVADCVEAPVRVIG